MKAYIRNIKSANKIRKQGRFHGSFCKWIIKYTIKYVKCKTQTLRRKIENFIFDTIIYVAAFGFVCLFCQLCAHADKWMGL